MPFLDWLLFKEYPSHVITLNIGGISNISYIKKKSKLNEVLGFDTGPGMSLIDEFVLLKWNFRYDDNGLLAVKGRINQNLLNYLLDNDYINKSMVRVKQEYNWPEAEKKLLSVYKKLT